MFSDASCRTAERKASSVGQIITDERVYSRLNARTTVSAGGDSLQSSFLSVILIVPVVGCAANRMARVGGFTSLLAVSIAGCQRASFHSGFAPLN
jgi:hypothetical protein